jgi:hypothetical protein
MFGTVLDKLGSYFGRPFLLSRCFPWLICLVVNLLIASIEFSQARAFVETEYAGAITTKAFDFVAALIAIGGLAYATSPIVLAMTEFLEGGWIGGVAARFLVPFEAARRERLGDKYQELLSRTAILQDPDEVVRRLRRERAVGARLRRVLDVKAIDRAEKLANELKTRRWLNRQIDAKELDALLEALSLALRSNCANVADLWDDAGNDRKNAERLSLIHLQTVDDLAPYAPDIGEQLKFREKMRLSREFAQIQLAPTKLGNSAAALRDYCESRYGIAFEAFWPRFLLIIAAKNDNVSDAIVAAKIQLDFSILCLTLTVASLASWIGVLWFSGRSLWTAAVIFIVGPALAWVWLSIVQSSYAAFAEVARSAVDLNRFDLLDSLHLPLPQGSEDEAGIWQKFAELALLNEKTTPVTYRNPVK